MTNRDYLRNLSNEKLAEFMGSNSEICNYMGTCCCSCLKCIKKWLDMERKPNIEKWQMRRDPYGGRFWLILHVGEENETHNWCLGLDEHGNVARISIDIVRTWILWDLDKEKNVNDVDSFLERLLNDLINKQP